MVETLLATISGPDSFSVKAVIAIIAMGALVSCIYAVRGEIHNPGNNLVWSVIRPILVIIGILAIMSVVIMALVAYENSIPVQPLSAYIVILIIGMLVGAIFTKITNYRKARKIEKNHESFSDDGESYM